MGTVLAKLINLFPPINNFIGFEFLFSSDSEDGNTIVSVDLRRGVVDQLVDLSFSQNNLPAQSTGILIEVQLVVSSNNIG